MKINVFHIPGVRTHVRQLVFSNGKTKLDASITDWQEMNNINEVYEVSIDILCAAVGGIKEHLLEHLLLDVERLYNEPKNNIVKFF